MTNDNQGSMIKEFRSKDVNRMRNLISGKAGERTQVLSGYERVDGKYSEGDVWEDQWGKTWTIRRGIKQTVTKMDEIKKLVVLPLTCPNCKGLMKVNELNKKMYSIHHKCFSCVIDEETQLKNQGKWEEYEAKQMGLNIKTSLVDFEQAIDQWFSDRDTFVSENGDVESWSGGDKSKVYKEIKKNLGDIKKEID